MHQPKKTQKAKRSRRRKTKSEAFLLTLNKRKTYPDVVNIIYKEIKPDETEVEVHP